MWTACTSNDKLFDSQPVGLPEVGKTVFVCRVTKRPEPTAVRDVRIARMIASAQGRVPDNFLPVEHRGKALADLPPEPPVSVEYDKNCILEARRIEPGDREKGQHVGVDGWVSDARPLGDDWTPTHWFDGSDVPTPWAAK
jgi:hypothetical protein